MTFVPGYEYDIFVSYAQIDDTVDPELKAGCVTFFLQEMMQFYSLYTPPRLSGNQPATPEIIHALRNSATLLLIVSPAYLQSEWSRWENYLLISRNHSDCVFIVEWRKITSEQLPTELQSFRRYRCWVEDGKGGIPFLLGTKEDAYTYVKVRQELSFDLSKQLRRLKKAAAIPAPEKGIIESPAPEKRPALINLKLLRVKMLRFSYAMLGLIKNSR